LILSKKKVTRNYAWTSVVASVYNVSEINICCTYLWM